MLPRPGELYNGPTDQQIMDTWPGGVMPAGWHGGPRTPQTMTPERQYAGHAQYDPFLFAQWRQQHPNDPRQYAGPGALPPDLAQKWYNQQGRQQWQQAVVRQANLPNHGGQEPLPQGGISRSTPGIPAGDDPIWGQRGKTAYQNQGQQFLPHTGPAAPTQGTPLDYNALNAALRGHPAGTEMTLNGRTYRINENGAIIDVTGGQRTRVTDRQGQGLPQNLPGVGATSSVNTGATDTGATNTTQSLSGTGGVPGGANTTQLARQIGPGGAPSMLSANAETGGMNRPNVVGGMDRNWTAQFTGLPPGGGGTTVWNPAIHWQNYDPNAAGFFNTRSPGYGTYPTQPTYNGPIFGP